MGTTIAIATGNRHKVEEINNVLRGCGYQVEPVDAPKIEIQSDSLVEIALFAASTAYSLLRRPVIVEDAGLFIEPLNGFPGPYSAYVYKTIGINGVLRLLGSRSNRRAYFRSVIALAYRDGIVVFEAETSGEIAREPRGSQGFGFDPIFVPEGAEKTFAEMSLEEKNTFSHRGKAAKKLCTWLKEHDIK